MGAIQPPSVGYSIIAWAMGGGGQPRGGTSPISTFVDYEGQKPHKVLPEDYTWNSPAGVGHIELYASHKAPPFASSDKADG